MIKLGVEHLLLKVLLLERWVAVELLVLGVLVDFGFCVLGVLDDVCVLKCVLV